MQDLIKNLENIHSVEELNKISESFHGSNMQDLIKNLENIHSVEELDKAAESFNDSRYEVERAIQKARVRIYKEQRAARRKEKQEFRADLATRIGNNHALSHESCVMIVDRAWESHHSYGMQEVTNAAEELAEFIEQIVKHEYPHQ